MQMGITGISGVGTFMEMEYKQSREMGTEEDVEIPCSFFDKKKKNKYIARMVVVYRKKSRSKSCPSDAKT